MKIENSLSVHDVYIPHLSKEGSVLMQKMMEQQSEANDEAPVSKKQVEEITRKLNEFLEIHSRSLKFKLHEELNQYYVQVIDDDTETVIREIPPKKLLDAFYTMQKFLGMIVDEKI
ncbi:MULTISPECIES: flagellar protein FlaG [Geobacillus]|uniref:Flagellar biosynthesis protein FlaG n=1 Tax=Geobacillus subterraneus TaxID=129338 RepID=A0A679FNK9_9BACL|nr:MULTISPECIES: flagellar protein FlaG [Geobacillus]NNV06869.1 flagellar protein FlaG [Geobacillus sp. MMMUD3]TWG31861.1 flagellar protein FlaG [Geobacillus sp. C56-T2]BBW97613.1 hypothetical protein GsuE55_24460 [Geobacillus subterraneus]